MTDNVKPSAENTKPALNPAAKRALEEAEARRRERDAKAEARATEVGGTDGPEPTRYGDWEKGGIASDF
jgi:hypothetical protein